MNNVENDNVAKRLFLLADSDYRDFHSALIPNVPKDNIIGVRMPLLRKTAKDMIREGIADDFINQLPHRYYEENNLHALIIARIKDFDLLITELERFLPFIDNWATCDSLRPLALIKNRKEARQYCYNWMQRDEEYIVRFAIEMLMVYFADEYFCEEDIKRIVKIYNDKYYVKMMIAWYFATLLAKQWDSTISVVENKLLDKWVHNKTIQKAVESFRLTDSQKQYLKSFKIREQN